MAKSQTLILWHGTDKRYDRLDPATTKDGGLHLGTPEQARMRNARVLYEIRVTLSRIYPARDSGSGWAKKIKAARYEGAQAVRYLNRYEGIPTERIEALAASGDLERLDLIPDSQVRRLVPEARDSYILLPGTDFEVLQVIETPRRARCAQPAQMRSPE